MGLTGVIMAFFTGFLYKLVRDATEDPDENTEKVN